MTDNFEKKVAVDGPVVNAGELGSSTFSPGQALPAGPLGLGQRREVVPLSANITETPATFGISRWDLGQRWTVAPACCQNRDHILLVPLSG